MLAQYYVKFPSCTLHIKVNSFRFHDCASLSLVMPLETNLPWTIRTFVLHVIYLWQNLNWCVVTWVKEIFKKKYN